MNAYQSSLKRDKNRFSTELMYSPQQSQPQLYQIDQTHNRQTVEDFIRECFYQQHGAQIYAFAPHLLALTDRQQQVVAALGYQSAQMGPLFLEQYLDSPIEIELRRRGIVDVSREQILEVGNLASMSSGSTRRLILNLISHFYHQGYRWLVVTITSEVFNSFSKLGIHLDLQPLVKAKHERLNNNSAHWGSYYTKRPVVYAGCFESAMQRLQKIPLLASLIDGSVIPSSDENVMLGFQS
jgi:Thermostable hemolysin